MHWTKIATVAAALAFAAICGSAAAEPPAGSGTPGGDSQIAGLLGQWDAPADEGSGKKPSLEMKSFSFGALFSLDASGRGVKCTHARGPGGPVAAPGCPYQHSQVNQDAESYVTWESVALVGRAAWKGMDKLTVTAEIKIGVSWSTLEYEVGGGSNWWPNNWPDTTFTMDSNVGFPHFGWRFEAVFKLFDAFAAGGGWGFSYGTGNVDPTVFGWTASAKGFYSFTEQIFYIKAQYELDQATPFLGFALTFHNGWAELKDKAQGASTYGWKWLLDYRETSQFSVVLGAEKKFDAGHYVRLELFLVGGWSARLVLGFMI